MQCLAKVCTFVICEARSTQLMKNYVLVICEARSAQLAKLCNLVIYEELGGDVSHQNSFFALVPPLNSCQTT